MMLYKDYLDCAKKHWKACNLAISSYLSNNSGKSGQRDFELLLDIYYLTGYMVEGCVVYSAYNLGGFPPGKHVKNYDRNFTLSTKIDFYYTRPNDPKYINPQEYSERRALNGVLAVQSHGFQEIVSKYLDKELHDNGYYIPYLESSTQINPNVKYLLDMWCPDVRYKTATTPSKFFVQRNLITYASIQNLVNTCGNIINSVDTYII